MLSLTLVFVSLVNLSSQFRYSSQTTVKQVTTVHSIRKASIDPNDAKVTQQVTIQVQIGNTRQNIVVGLFGDIVPITAGNFASICSNQKRKYGGVLITYTGTKFHRIIPNFMIQGGDFTAGDGTGGVGFNSPKFGDENFGVRFDRGVLAMANSGPDTNGSQFFITTINTSWLIKKHVVFGRVLQGMETVDEIGGLGTAGGDPLQDVTIVGCTVSGA